MPTVKYRISTRVSNGQAEVLARFYSGTVSQRAKTHIPVPVDAWDEAAGALIVPKKLTPESVAVRETQRRLDELKDVICTAWWRDRYDAQDGWLQQVIDEYHAIPTKPEQKAKRKAMTEVVEEYSSTKDLAPRSKDQYKVIVSALGRFEKEMKRTLYADTFSASDVHAFAEWFATADDITRSRNTIATKLKKLSAVCHFAVSRGYMNDTPFGEGKYKIQGEVYGDPVYLTIAERNHLYEAELPPALSVQRDIFIFQCHIGCRVSDLQELTTDNITHDGFVQYIQHKLRKSKPIVVRVPLSDTAQEIIARYKDKQADKRLLPFISDQKYNKAIHEMCRAAGLNRIVMVQDPKTLKTVPRYLYDVASSHLARRTFMANMFKATKSERITSAFTGHVNGSRAFSRYTSVDDEMKLEVLKNMNERKS